METQTVASNVFPEKVYSNKPKPAPGDFLQAMNDAIAELGGFEIQPEACDKTQSMQSTQSTSTGSREKLALGTITSNTPTVSDLLIKHPEYGKKCWKIIHSEINRGKSFTAIQPGTSIYLNPASMEISWNQKSDVAYQPSIIAEKTPLPPENSAESAAAQNEPLSSRLASAVKTYLGKPYKEIDCYELLVNGLTDMGVRYRGDGGLKDRLMKMAVDNGLSTNAYLSGEGIVSTLGNRLYSNYITRISNPEEQANRLIREIEPFTQEGFILSFSTPTRGHTGVISQKNDQWTFINSGRMDHRMDGTRISKGVGEESLNDEIKNWFKLAGRRRESLLVTLGQLDRSKLAEYADLNPPSPGKA